MAFYFYFQKRFGVGHCLPNHISLFLAFMNTCEKKAHIQKILLQTTNSNPEKVVWSLLMKLLSFFFVCFLFSIKEKEKKKKQSKIKETSHTPKLWLNVLCELIGWFVVSSL